MPPGKTHAAELTTDTALVRRLVAAQFPRWAGLPLASVDSAGTAHAVYRLGEDMVVRLPLVAQIAEPGLRGAARPAPAGWIHGDLQPGNLLLAQDRLSAVIDFGCLGLGDPAVDLIPGASRGISSRKCSAIDR